MVRLKSYQKKRVTEIKSLRSETFIIQRPAGEEYLICPVCSQDSMIAPEDIVTFTSFTSREIYQLVENGLLHYQETGSGFLFVCIYSLAQVPEHEKRM